MLELLSVPSFAFNFNLRRYIQDMYAQTTAMGDPLRSTSLLHLPFQIHGKQVMPLVTWFAWVQGGAIASHSLAQLILNRSVPGPTCCVPQGRWS